MLDLADAKHPGGAQHDRDRVSVDKARLGVLEMVGDHGGYPIGASKR